MSEPQHEAPNKEQVERREDPERLDKDADLEGGHGADITTLQATLGNDHVAGRIAALRGGGQPLDAEVQQDFGDKLGADLSNVRVHTGPEAENIASAAGAKAVAQGQDIVGGSSALDASSSEGRTTLAHEVVHTVQDTGAAVVTHMTTPTDAVEQEAVAGAQAITSGQSFNVGQSMDPGTMARSKQDVEDKLDESPFNAAELLALLQTQSNSDSRAILNDAGVCTKLVNKLNGSQMARAMVLLNKAPSSWGVDANRNRLNLIRRAGGTPSHGRRFLNTSGARMVAIAEDDTLRAWVDGSGGALTTFGDQGSGLSTSAVGSQKFMQWVLSSSTAPQILRALGGSSAPMADVITAVDGAGGWAWLDQLPNGAGLTAGQITAVQTLEAAAPDGSTAKTKLNGKLASTPHSGDPAEALTQLRAYLGGDEGTELEIIQLCGNIDAAGKTAILTGSGADLRRRLSGLNLVQAMRVLGATPPDIIEALKRQGTGTTEPLMSLLAETTLDERLALLDDLSNVIYLNTVLRGSDPRQYYRVGTDKQQFVAKEYFCGAVIRECEPYDALSYLAARDVIGDFATYCDGNAAATVRWLNGFPPKNQADGSEHNDLRALAIATSDATIDSKIREMMADFESEGDVSSPGAVPDYATMGPLERLDAELAKDSPSAREIISFCGALVHPENETVVDDSSRMDKIEDATNARQYYQCCEALRLKPKWSIKFLLRADHENKARIQAIINRSPQQKKLEICGWDDLVEDIRDEFDDDQALNVFGWANDCPTNALTHDEFREWVLEESNPSDLLRLFGGSTAAAARYAPILDNNDGWDWIDDLPGNALTPDERTALVWLKAQTNDDDAEEDIEDLLGDTEDSRTADEAFEEIKSELTDWGVDESQILRLATMITNSQRATLRGNTWMNRAASAMNGEEMTRYVMLLEFPLVDQLKWLGEATGDDPNTEHVQMLINRAPAPEQFTAIINADVRSLVRDNVETGPLNTFPSLTDQLVLVAPFDWFWDWQCETSTSLDLLRTVAESGIAAVCAVGIKAASKLTMFDQLPRGTGLTTAARGHCDTVFDTCNDLDLQKKIFQARWNNDLTGDWGGSTPQDLARLYARLKALPIEHVVNNSDLTTFNRHHNGGGTYGNPQINIGASLTYQWTQYDGTPQAEQVMKFDTTTRHEVGHAVDAMLGEQTSIVYDWAGWHKYSESDLDSWLAEMNGWDAGGGAVPTDQDKRDIKEVIRQYMNAGRLAIRGPGFQIGSLVASDHAWKRFSHVRIVNLMDNNNGLLYTSKYDDGSRIFSVNYYYNKWMSCKHEAGVNMPRDYSTFAPEEWFADMYGEFYREYDGTPATEGQLGGNCPGPVKTWFRENVHNIGRSPHELQDQDTPEGTAAPLH